MSSFLNSMNNGTARPEDTTNRLIDNPTHAAGESVGTDQSSFEEGVRMNSDDTLPLPLEADSATQVSDEVEIISDQDLTAGEQEPQDEELSATEEVMGAAPGREASTAVEEKFLQGELDVKEEMDRAARRMDYATGRSRPTIDPTPSL